MLAVANVEVFIPNEEVWERHSEIVHSHLIEVMLLAIVNEFMEQAACLVFIAKSTITESGKEYLLRLSIIVIECRSWFCRAMSAQMVHLACLVEYAVCLVVLTIAFQFTTFSFKSTSEVIVEIVVLSTIKFAFAKRVREHKAFLKKLDGMSEGSRRSIGSMLRSLNFLNYRLCYLKSAQLILTADLAFAAFPWMEHMAIDDCLCLFVSAKLIEKCGMFEDEVVTLSDDVKNILVLQNCFERIRKEVTNKVLSIKRISEFLDFQILAQPTLKKI